MPDDPWVGAVSSNGYSPDKFYTASRNKKGFGSSVRITVAPEVLSEISALVASRVVPEYQTSADFFRDCIVHRLKYLQGQIANNAVFSPSALAETMMVLEEQERISMKREAENRLVRQSQENLMMARSEKEKQTVTNAIRYAAQNATSDELRLALVNLL